MKIFIFISFFIYNKQKRIKSRFDKDILCFIKKVLLVDLNKIKKI